MTSASLLTKLCGSSSLEVSELEKDILLLDRHTIKEETAIRIFWAVCVTRMTLKMGVSELDIMM